MKDAQFFDAEYFGHAPATGPIKSNYGRVGGYHPGYAASEQFADWVMEELDSRHPRKKFTE